MLIWQGWGGLVPLIVFLYALITEITVESIFNDENYYQEHGYVMIIVGFLSSVTILGLWKWLGSKPPKILIDPETKEEIIFHEKHTFFFIDMKYWTIITFVAFCIQAFSM